ncbi:50S ribosomal protein L17 [Candidatus Uhrbacteria bacterium RIFOXYC2_FULL_47_19]|uniref:50S ribosomal protein L17 n=1 Tax=Candidatus Uhrbacteria bacterium RIFOXYC2_FULL_47_19 TaxID=1802424 RepID=A0A1F7WDZ6_9BACT|nr:MAG: 50S ribosomal protein L17 [Candidatus Uhrbacteria bacterium RIFOXYC2_FULL_47_19]
MRHRKEGKTLDRKKGPREALLRSLATSVIIYEKVQTTKAKAKAVQSLVERLITDGCKGDLTARCRVNQVVYGDNAVKKVVEELGPRYKDRKGGYTRVTGIGFRQGDGAEMVQIELV